jgi:hypothetical protein
MMKEGKIQGGRQRNEIEKFRGGLERNSHRAQREQRNQFECIHQCP